MQKQISRRDFLRGTAAGALGVAMSGVLGGGAMTALAYDYDGSAPITDVEGATISYLATNSWYSTVDMNKADVVIAVAENAGVTVDWNLIDPTTYTDTVSPMLAAGTDLADIIYLPDLDENQTYINSGMFEPLDDHWDQMPNFKAYLDENPSIQASLTAQDGHIYYVPIVGLPDNYLPCLMYQTQWLEQIGMEAPDTLDGFVEMLRAFKENDMNGDGDASDEIPMSIMSDFLPQMFGWAFGMDLNSGFYADDDGVVHYGYYEEEKYKAYLTFLNGLYEEGLLEMEFTSLTRDQITERFANNMTGVTFDYSWQMSQLYSTQFEDYNADEGGIVVGVPPLSGDYPGYYSGTEAVKGIFGVNKNASDLELALRFIDYAMSEECQTMYAWGIEDLSYTVDEDGNYAYTEQAIEDNNWLQQVGINPPNLPYHNDAAATDVLLPTWHVEIDKELATYSHAPWPFIYATEEEAEEIQMYLTDIETYVAEMHVKFITGTESLDNFDQYLSSLKSMGIEELLSIKQGQYDRYSGS
ncbi:MAG: substrate-binding domain-containing protein [Lachnospiraceae bacterium]|nr:substrate-binding domain-containing protein [Lachnospiraceae bacterium]